MEPAGLGNIGMLTDYAQKSDQPRPPSWKVRTHFLNSLSVQQISGLDFSKVLGPQCHGCILKT